MKPSISVLITSLNGGKKITRLLEQLVLQQGVEFELILTDDGSQPPLNSPSLGKLIRYEKNAGLIARRNELARLATAPLLLFLDDDVILPDESYLKTVVKYTEQFRECGVVAIPQKDVDQRWCNVQPGPIDAPAYCSRYFGWAHMVRRETWMKSGGLCEMFDYGFEETEHSWRMLEQGVKIVCVPELAVVHDAASASKNLVLRQNQNIRNSCLAVLLRSQWTTLPRHIQDHIRFAWQANQDLGQNWWMCLRWVFWMMREILSRLPTILQHRQPLARSTFKLVQQLESPEPFRPPIWPSKLNVTSD